LLKLHRGGCSASRLLLTPRSTSNTTQRAFFVAIIITTDVGVVSVINCSTLPVDWSTDDGAGTGVGDLTPPRR
jgi:hypothetical protein